MAEVKPAQKKKTKVIKRERKERRFTPEATYASRLSIAGGMVGALALGAGVYGQWLSDQPPKYAIYLFVAGAIAVSAALWFGDAGALPLRVGDVGIALERGTELVRIAWCDLSRLYIDKHELIAKGTEQTLHIPLAAQPKAVAWILSEGTRRVPEAMDVKSSVLSALPAPKDDDGEWVVVEGLQIAGRHCAASDRPIAFERDARLCPVCAQVYLKDQVPKKCVTCKSDLGAAAVEV